MGRWQSGQMHVTVNHAPLWLRRFESYPAHHAEIAQLVEHVHGKDGVPGSIPGLGSTLSKS